MRSEDQITKQGLNWQRSGKRTRRHLCMTWRREAASTGLSWVKFEVAAFCELDRSLFCEPYIPDKVPRKHHDRNDLLYCMDRYPLTALLSLKCKKSVKIVCHHIYLAQNLFYVGRYLSVGREYHYSLFLFRNTFSNKLTNATSNVLL